MSPQQLNFIRAQMQIAGASNPATNQPIIIQTTPQLQATPTLIQAPTGNVYLNAAQIHQAQSTNHPQAQQSNE